MKAIPFNGEINETSVEKFLAAIDASPSTDSFIVYFCSEGGNLSDAATVADYITRQGAERFTFVLEWECSSAALDLVCSVASPFEVSPYALSILHLPSNDISTRGLYTQFSSSRFLKNNIAVREEKFLAEAAIGGLTEEELQAIRAGQDVVISGERIRTFIEKVRVLREIGVA